LILKRSLSRFLGKMVSTLEEGADFRGQLGRQG
jgi:hypothetical protein